MNLELKDEKEEREISIEELTMKENEFTGMVGPLAAHATSSRNVESILKRAKLEAVVKDSADFVVDGVGKGFLGVIDTLARLGSSGGKSDDEPPKRSY